MPARVPVTVLTGFLGSGKTTLLNWLLKQSHDFKIAVIVNEFGELGVDGSLVAGGEQFVQLDNGCLCCVLNDDLDRMLRGLMARGGFDHLLMETTGVADPLPVAWTFGRQGLCDFYRVDAIVTVVDCAGIVRALEAPEAVAQIERADLLVLNKLDLVTDGGAAAQAAVRALNDHAPVLRAERGRVPWGVVLTSDEPSRLVDATPPADVGAAGASDARAHAHGPPFDTFAFETDGRFRDEALEDWLYEVPAHVYRLKGLVRTDAGDDWIAVNWVAGRFDLHPIAPERAPARGRLVFIGRGLDRDALAAQCRALLE